MQLFLKSYFWTHTNWLQAPHCPTNTVPFTVIFNDYYYNNEFVVKAGVSWLLLSPAISSKRPLNLPNEWKSNLFLYLHWRQNDTKYFVYWNEWVNEKERGMIRKPLTSWWHPHSLNSRRFRSIHLKSTWFPTPQIIPTLKQSRDLKESFWDTVAIHNLVVDLLKNRTALDCTYIHPKLPKIELLGQECLSLSRKERNCQQNPNLGHFWTTSMQALLLKNQNQLPKQSLLSVPVVVVPSSSRPSKLRPSISWHANSTSSSTPRRTPWRKTGPWMTLFWLVRILNKWRLLQSRGESLLEAQWRLIVFLLPR